MKIYISKFIGIIKTGGGSLVLSDKWLQKNRPRVSLNSGQSIEKVYNWLPR